MKLAAEALAARGITPTIADARFAKPLDLDLIDTLAADHEALITIETGSVGGFGSHVVHHLVQTGQLDGALKVRCLTLPDQFIDQASPAEMYAEAGLTAADIETAVLDVLGVAQIGRQASA